MWKAKQSIWTLDGLSGPSDRQFGNVDKPLRHYADWESEGLDTGIHFLDRQTDTADIWTNHLDNRTCG